jgi:hypothetical protein
LRGVDEAERPARVVVQLVLSETGDRERRGADVLEARFRDEHQSEDEIPRVLGKEPEPALAHAQRLVGLMPLRDVLHHAEHAQGLAARVEFCLGPHVNPPPAPVRARDPILALTRRVLGERPIQRVTDVLAIFRMHERHARLEGDRCCVVETQHEVALGREHERRIVAELHDPAAGLAQALGFREQILRVGERDASGAHQRVRTFRCTHVAHDAQRADDATRCVPHRRHVRGQVETAVVATDADRLEPFDALPPADGVQCPQRLTGAVGRNDEGEALPDDGLSRVSVHPLRARVPAQDGPVERRAHDRVVGRIDDGRVPLRDAPREGLPTPDVRERHDVTSSPWTRNGSSTSHASRSPAPRWRRSTREVPLLLRHSARAS